MVGIVDGVLVATEIFLVYEVVKRIVFIYQNWGAVEALNIVPPPLEPIEPPPSSNLIPLVPCEAPGGPVFFNGADLYISKKNHVRNGYTYDFQGRNISRPTREHPFNEEVCITGVNVRKGNCNWWQSGANGPYAIVPDSMCPPNE